MACRVAERRKVAIEIPLQHRRMLFSWISVGEYPEIWRNVIREIKPECRGMIFFVDFCGVKKEKALNYGGETMRIVIPNLIRDFCYRLYRF